MAGKSRRSRLILTDEEKADLERLARSRTAPPREKQRAAILLGYHAGENIVSIGRRVGVTRPQYRVHTPAGRSRARHQARSTSERDA